MADELTPRSSAAESEVSVVVSTYDAKRWADLGACLESLRAQTQPPREVIVVVDHNPDLFGAVRESFPWAAVVENHRPRGLAGARNSGIDASAGAIIAFIDDDARADPDWIAQLGGCFADPSAVGAGGALLPRWTNGPVRWLPREFYWVLGCSYTGLPEKLGPVRNPIGANMAVRARALRAVDGFREGGGEDRPRELRSRGVVRAAGNLPDDTDLAIRISRRFPESVWLYQPAATVHHTVTGERASLGYFLRRSFEEGAGKANLSRYLGSEEALSSERRYLLSALPGGFLAGLAGPFRGDWAGPLRAGAMAAGVLAAGAGFAFTKLKLLLARVPA
jgi:glycosyltransferase involved in cell wall biosynthesis